jgi:hypothetical protein
MKPAMQSLGQQLQRIHRATVGAAVGIVALLVITSSLALGLHTLVDTSRLQARVLADIVGAALAFDDARLARETLQTLRNLPQVQAATVHRADGRVFANYLATAEARHRDGLSIDRAGYELTADRLAVMQPVSSPT